VGEAGAAARAMWGLGDYHRFARATVWALGSELVRACGIGPGTRVLDVAAGSGNVALRAAEAGASVVASDLSPAGFEAGRREAAALGVEVEWVEADAQALPFPDGAFDAVTSCFGAMFAPDHGAVAREVARVCRPGGTIGMLAFRPTGLAAEFFGLLAAHLPPPPPGATGPPLMWGDEGHVRDLFGDRTEALRLERGAYEEVIPGGPEAYQRLFVETFGPVIAARDASSDGGAALDRELLELARQADGGPPGGPARYRYEYLRIIGRRA
jgi:SAM-dependent methyltransferase